MGGIQLYLGKVDDPAGYVINIFWGGVNIIAMLPMVLAALWRPESETPSEQQEAGQA